MSRPWNPDEEIARLRPKTSWPEGATVGLLIVAAACAGVAAILYHVAGPRGSFEDDSGIDWNEWS